MCKKKKKPKHPYYNKLEILVLLIENIPLLSLLWKVLIIQGCKMALMKNLFVAVFRQIFTFDASDKLQGGSTILDIPTPLYSPLSSKFR